MTRFALTWTHEGVPRATDVADGGSQIIGRDRAAAISIPIATMSRQQARVYVDAGQCRLQNLSNTNPTRINGVLADRPKALADGAAIEAGSTTLRFHDLASRDQLQALVCSHCQRENAMRDTACWFCGTELVNAPTAVHSIRRLLCRLVGADGQAFDLMDGAALAVRDAGRIEIVREAANVRAPAIVIAHGVAAFLPADDARIESADGSTPVDHGRLRTGNLMVAGSRRYVVVAR